MRRRMVAAAIAAGALCAGAGQAAAYPMHYDPAADYAHMNCVLLERAYTEAPYFRMDRHDAYAWMQQTPGWEMLKDNEREQSLQGLGVMYDNYERCWIVQKYRPLPLRPVNPVQMILTAMGSSH
ncbi:hypothetical protein ACFSSC_09285 [Corynebacterium mendelii]|uniref:Secreted protein n=1 Tax=Corynebacterium mendelii TaxID=2765362 RepID=A0A939IY52_9CORY|nr:hypothetical protein [Corynebacterium mendelii]MBN9645170.1 hypothetical protein [Corynebacterium mendelii]